VVAHAIFESELPIISAVGHETDFTIADFVADLRAPTPSAAAELAVPNVQELMVNLEKYDTRYKNALKKKLELMRLRYEKCMASRVFKDPLQKVNERLISIDMIVKQMQKSITSKVNDNKVKMVELITKLDSLSPLKTLARGYSLTTDKNGKVVNSVKKVKKDEELIIRFQDGSTNVKVL
jgi:exodeoxyribonuclease VII large subunit